MIFINSFVVAVLVDVTIVIGVHTTNVISNNAIYVVANLIIINVVFLIVFVMYVVVVAFIILLSVDSVFCSLFPILMLILIII